MRIGSHKVKLNYGILKGVIDVISLIIFVSIWQITSAFLTQMVISPGPVLNNIFPDGVESWRVAVGLIPMALAVIVLAVSIVYMFIPHKLPKKYEITKENAQQYYDVIMIANSAIRILCFLAIWDYGYISHSNLMFAGISWISVQAIVDVFLCVCVIHFAGKWIEKFARKKEKSE